MKKTMGKILALVIAAIIVALALSSCVNTERFDLANYDAYIISISIEPNTSSINNGKTMDFKVIKTNNKYRVTTYDKANPIYYYILEDETMFKYETVYGDFYNRTQVDTFSNEFGFILVGVSDIINNYRNYLNIVYNDIEFIITPDAVELNGREKDTYTFSGKIQMNVKNSPASEDYDYYVMGDINIKVELNKTDAFVIPSISK